MVVGNLLGLTNNVYTKKCFPICEAHISYDLTLLLSGVSHIGPHLAPDPPNSPIIC
jgi:hypothetical protein